MSYTTQSSDVNTQIKKEEKKKSVGDHASEFLGNSYHSGVRFDGGKGIVRDQRPRRGEGVEQGRLADVRESDDS